MQKIYIVFALGICLCGCGRDEKGETPLQPESQIMVVHNETASGVATGDQTGSIAEEDEKTETSAETDQKILIFRDVFGRIPDRDRSRYPA